MLAPARRAGLRVDELCANPDPIVHALHTAPHEMPCPERFALVAQVDRLRVERKARAPGDHRQATERGEAATQLGDDPLGEILEIRVAVAVLEGQDGQRFGQGLLVGPIVTEGDDLAHEPIALAVDGLDEARRLRVLAEHLAQLGDANLEDVLDHRRLGPDRIQEILLRVQHVRPLEQMQQQVVALGREVAVLFPFPELLPDQIEPKRSERVAAQHEASPAGGRVWRDLDPKTNPGVGDDPSPICWARPRGGPGPGGSPTGSRGRGRSAGR